MENQTKAIPLVTNRRVLQWLCVYPADENTSKSQQFAYILFTFIVFGGILVCFISSFFYFSKYYKTDLESALYTISQISGAIAIMYTIIITLFSRRGFVKIFHGLHHIYESSKKNSKK